VNATSVHNHSGGCTKADVDELICWLTGHSREALESLKTYTIIWGLRAAVVGLQTHLLLPPSRKAVGESVSHA
jgi:hypothetical protein